MRVSLFVTCLGDVFFPDAAMDAVRLLRSLDVEVHFPRGQTCCGQPALNTGQVAQAREMARHTRAVLGASEHVVLPSGSCTTMLRHFYPRLLDDALGNGGGAQPGRGGGDGPGPGDGRGGHPSGEVGGGAAGDPPRVWELSEFLVHALGVESLGEGLRGLRVAYHHGCHALRELGLREEAPLLLEGAGAEVVPWEAAEECCGFGGLFSVKFPEVSVAMADRKLDTLPAADVLTSADGGCLLQLAGRMERRGITLPALPLASLLWRGRNGGAA